ncbi:ATP-binding protein [Alphaproteobacteria bacterium]|nr:ATP-binding protein [Alphaproteobacteria bacterium]
MSDAAEQRPSPSANADAAEAEKLKFLGIISHELKTPLNAILGFSNLIEVEALEPLGDTGYKDFAQEIQTSGKSLLKLVNELIAVAQTEAGAVAFAESHVDVVSLAATTMASVASEAGRKGILLQNLIEDGAPAIWADQRAMAQALGAILDNAIKFTDKEGLVTLEYSLEENGDLRLLVSDTGCGIQSEKLAEIFKAFKQADENLNRNYEGAGLGLYLAQSLITQHNGRIEIETSPGDGARVSIILPGERLLAAMDEDDLTVMDDGDDETTASVILVVTHAGQRYQAFASANEFVIGRLSANAKAGDVDLVIDDRRVSRPHARLVWIDGQFHLVDESRRGSFVVNADGDIEHVAMNVSAPLSGAGKITLGDPADSVEPVTIEYAISVLDAAAA